MVEDAARSGSSTVEVASDPDAATVVEAVSSDDASGLPRPGERIGHFRVVETLGRGGMGVVVLGYDARLHRRVAIKLIDPELGRDPTIRARFLREARALAHVNHPNLVHAYEVGTRGAHQYIVMEYVEGRSLSAVLEDGPLPWREAVRILAAAGRGLAAAHRAGVIHRDFKPSNLLLGPDDRVRVADFGIARTAGTPELETPTDLTMTADGLASAPGLTGRDVLGTPAYMAPEQHAGAEVDARADQYAFCATLYEALAGRRPFTGGATLAAVKHAGPPALPSSLSVPGWLRRVLDRGLQPDPAARYHDMEALLDALDGERRRRIGFAIGVTAVVGLAAAGWIASPAAAPRCEHVEDMGPTWDAQIRARIRDAFAGIEAAHAAATAADVERRLDAYATAWGAMARDACEATHVQGTQSERVLDLRMACLARHREAMGAAVEVLAEADRAVARNASKVVAELPPIGACAEVERLSARLPLPDDPDVRLAIAQVQREYATVRALDHAGRLEEAAKALEPALARARTTDWPPLVAEGLVLQMNTFDADPVAQERVAREAIVAATAGGDERQAAVAWMGLIDAVGMSQGRVADAESLSVGLRAALARLDDDDPQQFQGLVTFGTLANAAGDYRRAAELYTAAQQEADELLGPDNPQAFVVANNLGTVLLFEGRTEEALAQFETALQRLEHTLGPLHPMAAEHHMNIGIVHLEQGDPERALGPLRKSIELLSDEPEFNARRLAVARANLGAALLANGDVEGARRESQRSLSGLEDVYPAGHPSVAAPLHVLGQATAFADDDAAARGHLERALRLLDDSVGPDHPNRAQVFLALAQLEVDAGRAADVVEQIERAHAILRDTRGADSVVTRAAETLLAEARIELGQPSPVDVDRARSWADAAPRLDEGRARYVLARILAAGGDETAADRELDLAEQIATEVGDETLRRAVAARRAP